MRDVQHAMAAQAVLELHRRGEVLHLTPQVLMSLDRSLEYIGPDELVEVTPKSIRIRKRILDSKTRMRQEKAVRTREEASVA